MPSPANGSRISKPCWRRAWQNCLKVNNLSRAVPGTAFRGRRTALSLDQGITWDKPARYWQYARNYQFFGAPVALFFAREKVQGPAQWADIRGYLQTVALLTRGFGLHTCPQQACVSFHRIVCVFLGLPDNLMIYSGMALGYQDGAAPSIPGALRALPSTPTHRSRASIAGGRQTFTSVQVAFTG